MRMVGWTQMQDGTKADYELLNPAADQYVRSKLVDNLFTMLRTLKGPTLGYQVDRYQHSLQSATRALRNDESVDLVVGALFHDVADHFAPENHSAGAAALLAPYVDGRTHWIVKHHGLFQGYYYLHHFGFDRDARDQFKGSPHYDACVAFCADYDQNCFDPSYDNLPLEEFEPMVRDVFARESRMPDLAPPSTPAP